MNRISKQQQAFERKANRVLFVIFMAILATCFYGIELWMRTW